MNLNIIFSSSSNFVCISVMCRGLYCECRFLIDIKVCKSLVELLPRLCSTLKIIFFEPEIVTWLQIGYSVNFPSSFTIPFVNIQIVHLMLTDHYSLVGHCWVRLECCCLYLNAHNSLHFGVLSLHLIVCTCHRAVNLLPWLKLSACLALVIHFTMFW
jgi:hypothetical protein